MGKRHSIAAKKAAGDQEKARNYSKIGKIIQLAAKGGADPSMNPVLELALQKAKYYNLPRDVVDKAIKKGSGQLKGEDLKEVFYEGYGPGGVAVLVKTLTDNTNRTSANIRTIFFKYGGNLGEPGSVAWQFIPKGVFVIDAKFEMINDKGNLIEKLIPLEKEQAEEELMDLDIEDIDYEDGNLVLIVNKTNFSSIGQQLKDKFYHIIDSAIHYLPDNTISLSGEEEQQLSLLIENLENDEDVDSIFHNKK
ncbi:MAG TPA: YebC/PmpR family DNA-binding transcriptional regulator [Candidatus Absconditabacterales bacterium]|nr:YebC/PmpR family DNA-binding transcriptional regulator [Candidatus Absconditabacterales bacterium]HPC34665.1 YebC/PmpR family DNA-binding transcriptional regulator [Candidatus Absconditabacterales bacterium]HPK28344.1 YebC/PmpR family DNA-binding transcriptional regulator [Candidatus Absconditabacterales bacterium]